MNFKKFISGVSAIAIAASAFAAMSVTASAKTREVSQAVYGTVGGSVTSNSNGTYAVSSTSVGAVVADLSAIEGLDDATTVTVQFDTKLPVVTSGSKQYIASVMYGVGDKAVRGTDENGSASAGSYVKEGLVAYFGSENGKNYYVNGDTSNDWTSSVKNKDVRATITLDRTTGEYSGNVALSASAKVPFSGTVAVGTNLNVIEVYTRGLSGYSFTFKNIKVTYTLDDPTPVDAGEVASFDNDEGACVYSATVENDAVYQAETVKAVAAAVGGATAEASASVSVAPGSALEIAVIVKGKTADEIDSVTVSLY